MAKILILSEAALGEIDNPFSLTSQGLSEFLSEQGHELIYLTAVQATQMSAINGKFEYIAAFQHWGWRDLPALMSLLFYHRPQILHIIQPHGVSLSRTLNIFDAATQSSPLWPRPRIITSILDARLARENPRSLSLLVRASHKIILASSAHHAALGQIFTLDAEKTHICPPLLPTQFWQSAGVEESRPKPPQPYLLIPGDLDEHHEAILLPVLKDILAKTVIDVVVAGGWGSMSWSRRKVWHRELLATALGRRLRLTGHCNLAQLANLAYAAHEVFLLTLVPDTLRASLMSEIGRQIRSSHAEFRPTASEDELFIDRMGPYSQENLEERIRHWLNGYLTDVTSIPAAPHTRPCHASDQIANQLQRLYQSLIAHDAKNQ